MRHIIFDCDGVLVDSEALANRVALRLLAAAGIYIPEPEYSSRYAGLMEADILLDLRSRHEGIPDDFLERHAEAARRAMEEELRPIAGMPELLRTLARPLSVASNSSESHVRHALRIAGAEDLFEGRIFSARQVPRPKPAPDVYLHALAQLGLRPEAAVVVEDSITGVTAARAAGLEVIAFLGAAHIFEGHEARVQAAGAARFARTPEALHAQLRAAGAA